MIVILGSSADPHVDLVARELQTRHGLECVVVDCLSPIRFSVSMDRQGSAAISLDGNPVTEPFLIWDRVKLLPGTELYLKGAEDDIGYAVSEWRSFYRLLARLGSLGSVNSLFSYTYLLKPIQQQMAAKVGFLVPTTLVTNDKLTASQFINYNKSGTIMKSLSEAKIRPSGEGEKIPFNIMTMRVDSSDVENATEDEISFCPHFFQEEIKKDYELRVVFVAGRIFPFRIDSQAYKTTEVDWRKGLWALEYKLVQLDSSITAKINDFMRLAELFGGSIDLIVDKSNEVWFLECNQDGAWEWLNELCGGLIAQAYADALAERFGTLTSQRVAASAL